MYNERDLKILIMRKKCEKIGLFYFYSEIELEDFLIMYIKLNKNVSVFLGGWLERSLEESLVKVFLNDFGLYRRKEGDRYFRR